MALVAQFEIEPTPARGEAAPTFNPESVITLDDGTPMNAMDMGIALIVIVVWFFIAWRLPYKAGYRGLSRWAWFAALVFIPLSLWSFLSFILVPWPHDNSR